MASARVPLDEQHVTEPGGRPLPALHPQRKEERCFLLYAPPPEEDSPAQVEEFLENSQFIYEDMEWLLALPHDKFWCQVVFDESLQRCLDSYLRLSPRGTDPPPLYSSPAVMAMQHSLHRSVFMVFLRMATHKESKENFLTPAVFAEIIYDNFLFDIPKILDLCVLFGRGNAQLLHKMIENIFHQQPSYYSDLNETVPSIIQVFDTVLEKCGLQSEDTGATEPLKLNTHLRITTMTMSEEDLSDLVLYLCDTCSTLHAFLDIFPEASSMFHQHGFLSRVSSFYEMAVPDLEKAVKKRHFTKCRQEDLWRRLCHSRRRIVEITHLLLQHTCLQPILEGSEDTAVFVDDLLQIFTAFLQEKRFLVDYDEQYPVADDISLLQQAFPHLDETRTSYLLQGLESAWTSLGKKRSQPSVSSSANHGGETMRGNVCVNTAEFMYTRMMIAGELESLLSHIRDLLPDLGEGFLMACLEEYGYDSELVINNILEEKLTPGLARLDRAKPRPKREALPSVLSSRSNVFDDDEFDVFNRDQLDMTRVWKGRKQEENVRDMLNDKQHITEQRARYQRSGDQVSAYDLDDYDDEYDDTYDLNQVGANDLDEDDDLLTRRPFTTPQVLSTGRQSPEEEEEDDKEEEKVKAGPAHLIPASRGAPPPASHVKGGPKGRGQTQETVLDRRKKETNKSRGANHNRRVMADRKRNKGMVPS
uniref:CUE domain-containing protein n=1 Tax=Electrophorus electricus TaxID=8005 RepID=A0A4W4F4I2_ELEEL